MCISKLKNGTVSSLTALCSHVFVSSVVFEHRIWNILYKDAKVKHAMCTKNFSETIL